MDPRDQRIDVLFAIGQRVVRAGFGSRLFSPPPRGVGHSDSLLHGFLLLTNDSDA
jgi:hypothetical protein